jgi:carbohydrate diacid regulator
MIGKVFQAAIAEMKEATTRILGVIDESGVIVACSDPSLIGSKLDAAPSSETAGLSRSGGYTFKPLRCAFTSFEYAAFVEGAEECSGNMCVLVTAGLNSTKDYYDEKNDRATFIKHIILDNILPGDIYVKSRELGLENSDPRAVFLLRQTGEADNAIVDVLKGLFPDRRRDFVISLGEKETVLVKEVEEGVDPSDIRNLAVAMQSTFRTELMVDTIIGIGTVCRQAKDLAAAYREAQVAIEVGKVFDMAENIVAYENLGLGRLIYQLPATMCEMFLAEIFKKNGIDSLDKETLDTILAFFENSLNISETSRKLFVHRNTLVYRLEKIKKLTGLDLREFDQAVVFKVALMVHKYLNGITALQGGALS